MKKIGAIISTVAAGILILTGCSGPATPNSATAQTPENSVSFTDKDLPEVEGAAGAEPIIHPSSKDAPKTLISEVLTKGSGEEVKADDTLTVHYKGQLWNGEVFDNSYARNAPASFGLNQVIAGWTQGLTGKHVGDRVLLVIPAELGYGEAGSPPSIPGNSTLVFVVDIIARQSAAEAQAKADEEQKQAARQADLAKELAPKAVKEGTAAQKAGKKLEVTFPKGINVTANPGEAAKITIDDNTKVDKVSNYQIIQGNGPEIPQGREILCNVTAKVGQKPQISTWSEDGMQLQVLNDIKNLQLGDVTIHQGDRVVRVWRTTEGETAVTVVDFMLELPK